MEEEKYRSSNQARGFSTICNEIFRYERCFDETFFLTNLTIPRLYVEVANLLLFVQKESHRPLWLEKNIEIFR